MTLNNALKLGTIVKRKAWSNDFYKVGNNCKLELCTDGNVYGTHFFMTDLLADDWVVLKPAKDNKTITIGGTLYEVIEG